MVVASRCTDHQPNQGTQSWLEASAAEINAERQAEAVSPVLNN